MNSATATRERPILFSAPMVRAILAGQKTQTRRVVTPQPNSGPHGEVVDLGGGFGLLDGDLSGEWRCPFGVPGDRLWVRESWQDVHPLQAEGRYAQDGRAGIPGPPPVAYRTIYRADGEYPRIHFQREVLAHPYRELCPGASCERSHVHPEESYNGWRPSIYMPRWASRLTLEITDVRVERLQDISADDCVAEGIRIDVDAESRRPLLRLTGAFAPIDYLPSGFGQRPFDEAAFIRAHYASLWDGLNQARGFGWSVNPWVWVVSFCSVGGNDA